MRSRTTNVLQFIVLISGIFYIAFGILFLVSPGLFVSFFKISLNAEWSNQIKIDDYLSLLYIFSQCFAFLLIFTGSSMILPLYDPKRYRELIYFNGVFFPVLMSIYMAVQYLFFYKLKFEAPKYIALIFVIIFILNLGGLLLTKNEHKHGIN
jgi:hypothetical protein